MANDPDPPAEGTGTPAPVEPPAPGDAKITDRKSCLIAVVERLELALEKPEVSLQLVKQSIVELQEWVAREEVGAGPKDAAAVRREKLNYSFAVETARRARDGDVEAAGIILQEFVTTANYFPEGSWPGPYPYPYIRYLTDAFEKILAEIERGDPKTLDRGVSVALGLKAGVGRPTGAVKHDPFAMARAYYEFERRVFADRRRRQEAGRILISEEEERERLRRIFMKELDIAENAFQRALREYEALGDQQRIDDGLFRHLSMPSTQRSEQNKRSMPLYKAEIERAWKRYQARVNGED